MGNHWDLAANKWRLEQGITGVSPSKLLGGFKPVILCYFNLFQICLVSITLARMIMPILSAWLGHVGTTMGCPRWSLRSVAPRLSWHQRWFYDKAMNSRPAKTMKTHCLDWGLGRMGSQISEIDSRQPFKSYLIKHVRCNLDVGPALMSRNQRIVQTGWRILIAHEDKVDVVSPFSILVIGGGGFGSLIMIR